MNVMDQTSSLMAEQLAQAASEFERQRTGHSPQSVTVVMRDDTLAITLHGSLSPIEKSLAMNPEGAAQVQEFHRQVFRASCDALRQQIKTITGVQVCQATAEVEPTTGTMVQVFLLAGRVPAGSWSSNG